MTTSGLSQTQERVRDTLRLVIEERNLPVSRLFLENPTLIGEVTLIDYFHLHLLAGDPCMWLSAKNEDDREVTMQVREWLTVTRRELIKILGECTNKGIGFEDIVILNQMFSYQILLGTFNVNRTPYDRIGERSHRHSLDVIFKLLEDLSCMFYTLPANEEVDDFLSRCHIGLGIARITLNSLFKSLMSLSDRSDEMGELFESFWSRIIQYAEPRICERGFEQFDGQGKKTGEVSFWRWLGEGRNFWTDDPLHDAQVLRELRIPEPLIAVHNPSDTLYLLQEVVGDLGRKVKEVALLVRKNISVSI